MSLLNNVEPVLSDLDNLYAIFESEILSAFDNYLRDYSKLISQDEIIKEFSLTEIEEGARVASKIGEYLGNVISVKKSGNVVKF